MGEAKRRRALGLMPEKAAKDADTVSRSEAKRDKAFVETANAMKRAALGQFMPLEVLDDIAPVERKIPFDIQALALTVGTPETTPNAITEDIVSFVPSKPAYVPVIASPGAEHGNCNPNVKAHIKRHGGKVVNGWCIWETTGYLITAEFHSVWQDENGDMYCVTPKPDGETQILFAADPKYPETFDFNRTTRPRNRRKGICKGSDEKTKKLLARFLDLMEQHGKQMGF